MKCMMPLSIAAALAFACGCQNKQPEAHVEEPYAPINADVDISTDGANYTSLDSLDDSGGYDTSSYRDSAAVDAAGAEPIDDEMLTPATGRVHVVEKGDTLYRLARHFYSDQARWRDIWDANRIRVPNPDRLYVGTKLIIP